MSQATETAATDAPANLAAPPAAPPDLVRVLHVINGEHYSGAERVQDLLGEHLPACGYAAGFACVKPDRFPAARKFSAAPLYELPMRSRLDRSCGRRVAQLVRDEGYQLLHAHTPRSLLVASQAARLADVPLVYHVHSPAGRDSTRRLVNRINLWTERRSAASAERLIAVSDSVRTYMIQQGFPAERVACVPNGVPRIAVPPRTAAPRTWTLGMVALFRPRKGVEVLLDALAAVRSTGAEVRLRAIGPFETTDYEDEVLARVDRLGLESAVDWTGFTTDIPAELQQVDALALPSLFGEGLPMVVLEAMAAAVPVVASHVEGIPTAIRHGQDGLLVEPNSVSQLAAAIEDLAAGRHNYAALSASAQQRHAEHFSAEIMAARTAQVYDAILAR
ncbi:MAG: glycosyltransferase family 1 protein [Planctomycetaceae bacterium]|nr:glycosyltransferase family 1 protein [Planctomycetaceae bacterium]